MRVVFARARECLDLNCAEETVVTRFQNQSADNGDKDIAHKTCAVLQSQAGTDQAADHVGNGHGQCEVPPHMTLKCEQNQGRKVRGCVHQFGAGRGIQKVVTQSAHVSKNKKTASAWPKKTIVKPDEQAHEGPNDGLLPTFKQWRMDLAHFFFGQGVNQEDDQ